MNLLSTLHALADTYHLDGDTLQQYAAADTVGGYHTDPAQRRWDTGSIWGVEGQVLYTLIRATAPKMIVNLGVYQGCSLAHITAAVLAVQRDDKKYNPTIVAVDLYKPKSVPMGVEFLGMDALEYVEKQMPSRKVDLLFEDLYHGTESTQRVWAAFQKKANKGAFIMSHDAAHFLVGADVRFGILASGVTDPLVLDIEPSDCGLAVWRKP